MDAAYAIDGILDFDAPVSDAPSDPQPFEQVAQEAPGFGPGQGDATVLAWARAM